MHVLAALTRLRQICCHPSLAGGKKGLGSGKTTSLFDVLEPLYAGGHKVLVFSQFVEMLKILKAEMEERGRPYFMLTGQTTQRGEVVLADQGSVIDSIPGPRAGQLQSGDGEDQLYPGAAVHSHLAPLSPDPPELAGQVVQPGEVHVVEDDLDRSPYHPPSRSLGDGDAQGGADGAGRRVRAERSDT